MPHLLFIKRPFLLRGLGSLLASLPGAGIPYNPGGQLSPVFLQFGLGSFLERGSLYIVDEFMNLRYVSFIKPEAVITLVKEDGQRRSDDVNEVIQNQVA